MDLIKFNWKWTRKIGFIGAFFALFTAFSPVVAQEKIDTLNMEEDTTYFFVIVEQMPEFPGGDEARIKFLQENLKYPALVSPERLPSGRVVIGFIVEADGKLSNCEIIRSVHPLLDDEALRVVKMMPNWIPGKERGKAVRVHSVMPITFALNEYHETKDAETEVKKSTKKDKKRKK